MAHTMIHFLFVRRHSVFYVFQTRKGRTKYLMYFVFSHNFISVIDNNRFKEQKSKFWF